MQTSISNDFHGNLGFLTTLETDGDVCSLEVKFWQLELVLKPLD